ncbi:MAG: hypothetical protein Q9157_004308 [Trypethelium eluteriae]
MQIPETFSNQPVKTGFGGEDFDWKHYDEHRPTFPKELFDTLFDYHEISPTIHGSAVDCGCGSTHVTRRWANQFATVHAVDPGAGPESHAPGSGNLVLHKGPAEDLSFLDTGSVDMVVSSCAAHYFDRVAFLPEAARVLRSEGTLAIWSLAPTPHIGSRDSMATKIFKNLLQHCIPYPDTLPKENIQGFRLGISEDYDCWEFPAPTFGDVRRIWWNRPQDYPPFIKRENEERIFDEKPEFMSKDMNVEQLREYQHTLCNLEREWIVREGKPAAAYVQEAWDTLETEFGGPSGILQVFWPCFMVLARRK